VEHAHEEATPEVAATPAAAAAAAPGLAAPLTPAGITALQRTIGNAAVGGLIRRRQLQREPTAEQRAEYEKQWKRSGDARALISKHNFLGIPAWLRVDALATELLGRLPADWDIALECISQLVQGHQDSDLAVALCKNASDDKLKAIAADPGGAKLMFRIVGTMQGLTTSDAEKAQLYRAMTAITRGRGGTPMSVEVITFRSGFKPLDAMGEWWFGKGAKGHTAVIVADLVYSFDERGWVMEGSKAEYMGRNTHRDAIGQVLKVPSDDALVIQDGLNKSIGHGVYFFSGLVCTDATALSLVKVLGSLDARSNPQKFADMLAASGHVDSTNSYAKATP
jgi:hypothetical protein